MKQPWSRRRILIIVVALFCLANIPQPDRSRPSTEASSIWEEPTLPAAVGDILDRSCADCHSHRTQWPWYSYVAPVSWLVSRDVHEGRRHLNFSQWGQLEDYRRAKLLEEICEEVEAGEMPLEVYRPLHPDAKLSDDDVRTLCDWSASSVAGLKAKLGAAAAD